MNRRKNTFSYFRRMFVASRMLLGMVTVFLAGHGALALNVDIIPNISQSNLIHILNNPKLAKGARYNLTDSSGQAMQTPSIIDLTNQPYKYAAVYHTPYPVEGGYRYKVNLAVSNNLLNWQFVRSLVDNADMPRIVKVKGASWLVLVHEQWLGPDQASTAPAQLGFQLFYDANDLLNGIIRSTWIQPQYMGDLNGTPSIYNFSLSLTNNYYGVNGQFGFHFWDGSRDVNAVSTIVNLFNPSTQPQNYPSTAVNYNNLFMSQGVSGNIGQRDTIQTTGGRRYNIQEGNIGAPGQSWELWRVWLYTFGDTNSYPTGNGTVLMLSPQTVKGSSSFGNPSITVVKPPLANQTGKRIVVSYFLFSEGAAPGEAGSLLYFFDVP